MSDAPKVSAVLTARARNTIALPPCEMGWADLITPKGFERDAPKIGENAVKYMLDCHYTPAGLEALKATVLSKCLEAQRAALEEAAAKNGAGTKLKPPIPLEEWLEAQLKSPKPKSRIQLPFIKLRAPGYRKDRNGGDPILNIMGCWGPDDQPLDLVKLRLSAGSVVQPIVFPNLFASKAGFWTPQPSLKLVGVRVLRPVSFGAAGGPRGPGEATDDEAIKAVMGAEFDIHSTDFSAYAAGASEAPPVEDLDDEDSLRGTF